MQTPSMEMSWEEDMYWTHFRSFHFFCHLPTGFHDHLAIPRKFSQKMRSKLPEKLILKAPGGDTWNVSLISLSDNLFFGDIGWEEFVKDHGLQENDMLVFKYDGVSQFDVLMFGSKSKCEKKTSYFVKRSCEIGSREDNRNSLKWFKDVYWAHFRCVWFLQQLSIDFHTQLALPRKVFEKLVAEPPETVILRCPSGATWNVRLSIVGQMFFFKDGWQEFSTDNSLKENDIMIFRFNKESRFDVLIFDSETMCEKASSYFIKTSRCSRPDGEYKVKNKTKRGKAVAKGDCAKVPDGRKTSSSASTSSDNSARSLKLHKTLSRRDTRSESAGRSRRTSAPYAPRKRGPTEEEQNKALRSANAALTDKSFLVVMYPTYVKRQATLHIPSGWSRYHLDPEAQQVILRVKEKKWIISVRWSSSQRANFGIGWWKFVMDNKLKVFDVCVFARADGAEPNPITLDVLIFRPCQDEPPVSNLVL